MIKNLILSLCILATEANELDYRFNDLLSAFRDLDHTHKLAKTELEGHIGNFRNGKHPRVRQLRAYFFSLAARADTVTTYCETGFNGGHSALLARFALPDVNLVFFDMCTDARCDVGKRFITDKGPRTRGFFTIVKGDSTRTVPQYAARHPSIKCQWLSVDGGHFGAVPAGDVLNLKRLADCRDNVVVMDDIGPLELINKDKTHYTSIVGKAWYDAVDRGDIHQLHCEQCSYKSICHFCVGRYMCSKLSK